jgi:anion-transporting  ArsA/GET3 family ATPase
VGPIRRQALKIHTFLVDPASTGVLVVALPEEMPVNETLELGGRLRDEMGMGIETIVVNALYPQRFTADEAQAMESLDGRGSAAARAALRAALAEHHWARLQRAQLRRLRRHADAEVATLPYLFEPELEGDHLEQLSLELERKLS